MAIEAAVSPMNRSTNQRQEETVRRRRSRRWIVFFGLGLLLGLYGWLAFSDIPPIDDSDLILERPSVSEEDNAYFWLVRAREASVRRDHDGVISSTIRAGECSAYVPIRGYESYEFGRLQHIEIERELQRLARTNPEKGWKLVTALRAIHRLQFHFPRGSIIVEVLLLLHVFNQFIFSKCFSYSCKRYLIEMVIHSLKPNESI